jgi:hypothetical protein
MNPQNGPPKAACARDSDPEIRHQCHVAHGIDEDRSFMGAGLTELELQRHESLKHVDDVLS